MNILKHLLILIFLLAANFTINAQQDSSRKSNDSSTNLIPDFSALLQSMEQQIGRASCRERVCELV